MLRVDIVLMRALEITFFTGLAGCALTVVLSWISIFGGELAKEEESRTADPIKPSPSYWSNFFHSELKRHEEVTGGFQG